MRKVKVGFQCQVTMKMSKNNGIWNVEYVSRTLWNEFSSRFKILENPIRGHWGNTRQNDKVLLKLAELATDVCGLEI